MRRILDGRYQAKAGVAFGDLILLADLVAENVKNSLFCIVRLEL